MTEQELKAIEERRDQAHKEIVDLCNGSRRWTMCIPVQDNDSDLVLGNALRDSRVLQAALIASTQPAPATDAAAEKPLSCPSCNNKSDFGLCSVCGGSCFRMGSHTRPEALYNVGMGWQERAERAESEAKRLREALESIYEAESELGLRQCPLCDAETHGGKRGDETIIRDDACPFDIARQALSEGGASENSMRCKTCNTDLELRAGGDPRNGADWLCKCDEQADSEGGAG